MIAIELAVEGAVFLLFADFALNLALELLGLAFDLLALIAGHVAGNVLGAASDLVAHSFELLVHAFAVDVVRHRILTVLLIGVGAPCPIRPRRPAMASSRRSERQRTCRPRPTSVQTFGHGRAP